MESIRRRHNKVRSGCVSCKQRKIKCDESKPTCLRCIKSERECRYSVPKTWIFEPTKCLNEPGDWEDRRALSFFREKTALLFAGRKGFTYDFWMRYVPQLASFDVAIWHLTVALGARHDGVSDLADKHHSAALWILSRSISRMPSEAALLGCQLLGANCIIAGEPPANAAKHLSFGLEIARRNSYGSYSDFMLLNLEIEAAVFAPVIGTPVLCSDVPKPIIPNKITDLVTAKNLFLDILRWRFTLSELQPSRELLIQWTNLVKVHANKGDEEAQTMLFQSKVLWMYDNTALAPTCSRSRVKVLLVDLSNPRQINVICSLEKTTGLEKIKVIEDRNPLSLWPKMSEAGFDGDRQVIRLTLSR